MTSPVLYKYLDADGGLNMLKYHNLQFTNASRLNDPFDCRLFGFLGYLLQGIWKSRLFAFKCTGTNLGL